MIVNPLHHDWYSQNPWQGHIIPVTCILLFSASSISRVCSYEGLYEDRVFPKIKFFIGQNILESTVNNEIGHTLSPHDCFYCLGRHRI